MSNISQWDPVANNNNDPVPDGMPEGATPYSGVNDSFRESMAAISRQYLDTNASIASTGTGNNYIVATNNAEPTDLAGVTVVFIADKSNTGAATLERDTRPALPLVYSASEPLPANAIKLGRMYTARCDGTRYILDSNVEAVDLINQVMGSLSAATGDMFYYDGTQFFNLAIGAEGHALTSVAGLPSYQALPAGNSKPVVTDAGGSRNLTAADMETFTKFTSSSALTLTVPADIDLDVAIGSEVEILQEGTGLLSLAAGAGATVNPPPSGTLNSGGQWAVIGLKKIAANTWVALGSLAGA